MYVCNTIRKEVSMYMNQSIYVWFMDLFILRSFVQNAELPPLAGATTTACAFSNASNEDENVYEN